MSAQYFAVDGLLLQALTDVAVGKGFVVKTNMPYDIFYVSGGSTARCKSVD